MKNIIPFLLCAGLLISPIACTNLEEINIDPTRPSEVDLRFMLPEAMTQTAFNQSTHPTRVAGIMMQQFRSFDDMKIPYAGYSSLSAVSFDAYWVRGLYVGSLRSAKLIADKATAENAPHYAGIAKILLAIGYGNATSYWGDIPFSDALMGIENLQPEFDTQEQVYQGVQTLLDEAIDHLSQASGGLRPEADDLIFGGDAAAWIATAHALKARYLMHTIKRNPNAASSILDIIRNKAFQSIESQPGFMWGTTFNDNNPLAKFGLERPNTIIIEPRFAERMQANDDPREDVYMLYNGFDYFYFDTGIDGQLYWAQNNTIIPLISLEELKFIEAELEWMQGNEDAAKAALLTAVATNMSHIGVDGADYLTALEANYDTALDKYEIIMTEAYTAYYGQAFDQSWANYRRTGYPKLIAPPESDTAFNPGGGIPQRYIYPLSEVELNGDNAQIAADRQSGALMNIPLWAFQ